MDAQAPPTRTARPLGAALSAFYVSNSWLWCIGLFLPVLLVRDFGWPGWAAFAAPNLVGATAVGFAFARPGSAVRWTRENLVAARAFSIWTVLFHAGFLSWITSLVFSTWLGLAPVVFATTVFVLMFGAMLWSAAGVRTLAWAGVVVFALSWWFAFMAWRTSGGEQFVAPPSRGAEPAGQLALGAVPLAFGFLLCPRLDLTLLRVRDACPGRPGTAAFVVGFGVLFLSLIGLSLAYATRFLVDWTSYYIVAHMGAQSLYSVALHVRELRARGVGVWAAPRGAVDLLSPLLLLGLIALACAGAWAAYSGRDRTWYEVFLAPYASVFPLYVWSVILLGPPVGRAGARRILLAIIPALVVAGPMLWVGGAIDPRRWWLAAAGIGVMVAWPVALRAVLGRRV